MTPNTTNENDLDLHTAYDMPHKAYLSVIGMWELTESEVSIFIRENDIEKKVLLEILKEGPVDRTTEEFKKRLEKEVQIRGTEELINSLYREGKRPKKKIKMSTSDAFFETCKCLKYLGEAIYLPILPRKRLV